MSRTHIDLEWTLGPDIDTERFTRSQTLKVTIDLARPLTGAQTAALADIVRRLDTWAATTAGLTTADPLTVPDLEPMPRLPPPVPWRTHEDAFVHGYAQGVNGTCDTIDEYRDKAVDGLFSVSAIRDDAVPAARRWLAKARGEA